MNVKGLNSTPFSLLPVVAQVLFLLLLLSTCDYCSK